MIYVNPNPWSKRLLSGDAQPQSTLQRNRLISQTCGWRLICGARTYRNLSDR